MSNGVDPHLLRMAFTKLAEEATEVAKDALKVATYGPANRDPAKPDSLDNLAKLEVEMAQLLAVARYINDELVPLCQFLTDEAIEREKPKQVKQIINWAHL